MGLLVKQHLLAADAGTMGGGAGGGMRVTASNGCCDSEWVLSE